MLRVPVGVIWLTSRVLDILKVCARARNADKMSVAMFHAQSYPFTSAGMTDGSEPASYPDVSPTAKPQVKRAKPQASLRTLNLNPVRQWTRSPIPVALNILYTAIHLAAHWPYHGWCDSRLNAR